MTRSAELAAMTPAQSAAALKLAIQAAEKAAADNRMATLTGDLAGKHARDMTPDERRRFQRVPGMKIERNSK